MTAFTSASLCPAHWSVPKDAGRDSCARSGPLPSGRLRGICLSTTTSQIYRKFTSASAAGWSSELAQLLMSTLVGRPMPFNLHPPLQLLRNTNAPNAGRGSPTGGVWLITRRHTSSRFERLPEPLLTHCHGQTLERRGRGTGGWLDIRWAGSLRWILNSTRILIQG